MSWWNNTLLSAGTGLKFPFRLSFIRPYSTCRNWERSLRSCFVLRGDSVAACSWFRTRPLLPSQITSANTNTSKPLSHHSLWVWWTRPAADGWLGRAGKTEEWATFHTYSQEPNGDGLNIRQWGRNPKAERTKIFCHQSASKTLRYLLSTPLSNCHRTFHKIKGVSPKKIVVTSAPPTYLFLLNTGTQQHLMSKRKKKCLLLSRGSAKR